MNVLVMRVAVGVIYGRPGGIDDDMGLIESKVVGRGGEWTMRGVGE